MIVLAVHPWFMSIREDIITAMRVGLYYPPLLPTELIVTCLPVGLMIAERKRWIQRMHGCTDTHMFALSQ